MWDAPGRWRWWLRAPAKVALFAAFTLIVLFPLPHQLVRQVGRYAAFEELIDPNFEGVEEANAAVDALLGTEDAATPPSPLQQFEAVQRAVYQRIPYAYDWDNWGNADYWPTASEAWARGREDCDGQAILAASILRSRGFESATIVGNMQHIWVQVDDAEMMSPQAEKSIERDASGRLQVNAPSASLVLDSLAFTVSEFPALRNVLLLAAALALLYHPRRRPGEFAGVLALGLFGFVMLGDWAGDVRPGAGSATTNAAFWIGAVSVAASALWAAFSGTGQGREAITP